MIIGVFPEQGGSLQSYGASGQDGRLVTYYLKPYARAFEKAYFFSYAKDSVDGAAPCELIPNKWRVHRWAYAFCLPFIEWRRLRQCSVLRAMQMTGEVPLILSKILFGIPIAATYGYHYAHHARVSGSRVRFWLFRLRVRLALCFLDKIIVTTPSLYSYLEDLVPRKRIVYIPNGVDTALFAPGENKNPSREKIVVAVGALKHEKNYTLLIDALSTIDEPVIARIIGDGQLRDELTLYARERGVRAEFLGMVPHEKIPHYLRQADVFAMTSHTEGHPKALLEAMSCGCACVGTDVPGIRDVIINNENGFLCAPDAAACAKAIEQVFNDPALAARLRQAACAYVEEHYSLPQLVDKEISMLKTLAGEKPVGFAHTMIARWQGRIRRLQGGHDLWQKVRERAVNAWWACATRQGRATRRQVSARVKTVEQNEAVDFPDMLHIELTNRCNLDCEMCSRGSFRRKLCDMDLDMFTKVIDECAGRPVDAIALYYFGEVLLYEQLEEAVRYVRARLPNVHTRIRTNAQLLTEDSARMLLASGLTSLEFSIDGYDKASYESIMRGAQYETLINNLDRYFMLKRECGNAQQNLIVTIDMDRTRTTMPHFVRRWNRYAPVSVTALHSAFVTGSCGVLCGEEVRATTCPEVFYHAIVLSNGEVTFCCADVEGALSIGNVAEHSLHELWHNTKARQIRRIHREKSFTRLPVCAHCSSGILRRGVNRR